MEDREWVAKVRAAVRPLIPKEFVGQIEINCLKGEISNINVRQSFKPEPDSRR
jgi:hypothetical protein